MEENIFKNQGSEAKDENLAHESSHGSKDTSLKSQLIEYFAHGKWSDTHTHEILKQWEDLFIQNMYSLDKKLSDQDIHLLWINAQIEMLKSAREKNENPEGKKFIQSLIDDLYRQ